MPRGRSLIVVLATILLFAEVAKSNDHFVTLSVSQAQTAD